MCSYYIATFLCITEFHAGVKLRLGRYLSRADVLDDPVPCERVEQETTVMGSVASPKPSHAY